MVLLSDRGRLNEAIYRRSVNVALPDIALQRQWSTATGSADDKVKPFGFETDELSRLRSQRSQAWRLVSQQLSKFSDASSSFLNYSLVNEASSDAFDLAIALLHPGLSEDLLYDYKLSPMPKSRGEVVIKVINGGKAEPKFHFDSDID